MISCMTFVTTDSTMNVVPSLAYAPFFKSRLTPRPAVTCVPVSSGWRPVLETEWWCRTVTQKVMILRNLKLRYDLYGLSCHSYEGRFVVSWRMSIDDWSLNSVSLIIISLFTDHLLTFYLFISFITSFHSSSLSNVIIIFFINQLLTHFNLFFSRQQSKQQIVGSKFIKNVKNLFFIFFSPAFCHLESTYNSTVTKSYGLSWPRLLIKHRKEDRYK